jgi:hypothetical protein
MKILSFLVVLISVPTFAQNFNKVKVDSLFQVLKTNDKFMGSVAVSENGKSFTRMPSKDDMANNKRQLLARNIELVLYLKCLLQF